MGALHASGSGRQPPDLISTPGNIRVLCRLRPGTPSNLVSLEPGPGGTVTTCYRGHQRRFRLDWVFPPHASQEEVMLHPFTCVSCHSEFPGDQRRLLSVCPPRREGGWTPAGKGREPEGLGGRTGMLAGHLLSFQDFRFASPHQTLQAGGDRLYGLNRKINIFKSNFVPGNEGK